MNVQRAAARSPSLRAFLVGIIALVRYLVATHPKRSMRGIVKLVETTAMRGQREFELDPLYEFKREGIRFGRVPADVRTRVFAATEPMLKRWSLRVLKAPTLEAVFGAGAKKQAAARPQAKGRRAAARKRARPAR